MSSPGASREKRLQGALAELPQVVLAVFIVVLLVQTFLGRVDYPYDLEWMEGGMLVHGLRVMQGQGIYVEPSEAFIPYIYPPLYAWMLGGLGQIFGLDYALGRTISLVGTLLGAAALIPAIALERKGWLLGVAAAGLFITGYDEAGSFYDLVRADGILIGLLAWSLVAARHGWLRTSGLLLTGAYLAKHSVAILGLTILLWLWKNRERSEAVRFVLWSVLPALGITAAVQLSGDGLFLTYLLGVPSRHPFVLERFIPGTEKELFLSMPLTAGLALLLGLGWLLRKKVERLQWPPRPLDEGLVFWLMQGGMLILLSAIMRGHHGGYVNVLIPGLWATALFSALAIGRLREEWDVLWLRGATGVLIAVQIWLGQWDPAPLTPPASAAAAGDALIAEMAAVEGEIFAPHFPWYPVLAGKAPQAHLIALWDIDHEGGPLDPGADKVREAMEQQRWAAVFSANSKLGFGLKDSYRRDGSTANGAQMKPVTGWPVRPRYIYVPRQQ